MKRSPMPRKRPTKRRTTLPRCKNRQCKKPAKVLEWCRTHAMREADRLAREIVMQRDEVCRAAWKRPADGGGWQHMGATFECSGSLQWCHVHSRSYHAIRHSERNAIVMCAAHHAYFTHHPLQWEQWCRDNGIAWDELRIEALHGAASWSLDETLIRLSGAA